MSLIGTLQDNQRGWPPGGPLFSPHLGEYAKIMGASLPRHGSCRTGMLDFKIDDMPSHHYYHND